MAGGDERGHQQCAEVVGAVAGNHDVREAGDLVPASVGDGAQDAREDVRDLPEPGEPEPIREVDGVGRHDQLATAEKLELEALHGYIEALLLDAYGSGELDGVAQFDGRAREVADVH